MSPNEFKDSVVIKAFASKRLCLSLVISTTDYYECSHKLIDSAVYRKKKKIDRVIGMMFDESGAVEKEFETFYDKDGNVVRNISRFPDGTVNDVRRT